MNIRQQMAFSSLAKPPKPQAPAKSQISADALINQVFSSAPERYMKDTEESYQKRHVSSSEFNLVVVPLNILASPIPGNAAAVQRIMAGSDPEVIIVDLNKRNISINDFKPKVIVIEGAASIEAAHLRGLTRIPVWLGNMAAAKLDHILADDAMSSDELSTALRNALEKRHAKGNKPAQTSKIMNWDSPMTLGNYVYIEQVYPFENYCIYRWQQRSFRQHYEIVGREVNLTGPAQLVEQKFVDVSASTSLGRTISLYACGGNANCGCGCGGSKVAAHAADGDGMIYDGSRKRKKKMDAGDDSSMEEEDIATCND